MSIQNESIKYLKIKTLWLWYLFIYSFIYYLFIYLFILLAVLFYHPFFFFFNVGFEFLLLAVITKILILLQNSQIIGIPASKGKAKIEKQPVPIFVT